MTEMTPAEAVYFAAAALPAGDRAAYLDRACVGNDELRRQVERMLAARAEVGDFLEPPSAPQAAATAAFATDGATGAYESGADHPPAASYASREEHVGSVIAGKYKLVEEIGEGGMGSVFMAQQTEPVKRAVAVKVIKAGMDSKAVLARFDAERQALAVMDHPNIAKVLDAGTTETGRPFFVMELVKGVPITQFCDDQRLSIRERLGLFVPVCQAIQHAHQKGIIHRDIKPSNVLIALYDDKPVPKVIDFGIAKAAGQSLTDHTLMTGFGAVVGTPEYMSPEQASLNNLDIDTRSDVYALGVLLYELLTGSTPVDRKSLGKAAILEILRIVREVEVPRPSAKLSTIDTLPSVAACRGIEPAKLSRLMRGELDWVLLKALEKDRARRYESANSFAAEVQRYLDGEAVQAHPPSTAYRLRKFVRRNKGQVLAASLILFALIAGMAGTTWGLIEAKKQEGIARDEADEKEKARAAEAERVGERDDALRREAERTNELKHRLGVSDHILSRVAYENNDAALALDRLDRVPPEQRGWAWQYLKKQAVGGVFTLKAGETYSVAYHPDGTRIATCNGSGIKEWDARNGTLLRELNSQQAAKFDEDTLSISYSPEGNRILRGGGVMKPTVWDTRTGKIVLELDEPQSGRAVFNSKGHRILTVALDGKVRVWDAIDGKNLVTLNGITNEEETRTVNFTPDGKRIVGTNGAKLGLWDAEKKSPALSEWKLGHIFASGTSCSPDGTKIVVGFHDGSAQVLDANDGTTLFTLKHRVSGASVIRAVAFSPDGKRIVTAGGTDLAGEVRVWDANTGAALLDLIGHQALVWSVAFSPDGTRIVTGSKDKTAKVWDTRMGTPWIELKGNENEYAVNDIAFSPDGSQIVTASGLQYSPVVSFPSDKMKKAGPVSVRVWDARTGQPALELKGLKGVVQSVRFSPDGSQIATGGWVDVINQPNPNYNVRQGHGTLWNGKTGQIVRKLEGLHSGINSLVFSPDGERIATAGVISFDRFQSELIEVKMWDAATGETLIDMTPPQEKLAGFKRDERGGSIAFSPDGTRIVLGGLRSPANGGLSKLDPPRVCDARSGKLLFELPLKKNFEPITSVAFSADGTRIVVCNGIGASVWDVSSDRPAKLPELEGHTAIVNKAAFSPDGNEIATASNDGTVRVWDVRTGTTLVKLQGQIGELRSVAFSPDGRRIAAGGTGAGNNTVWAIVWDVSLPATPPK